jgi:hypothetical protein
METTTPVAGFVADRCDLDADRQVEKPVLYGGDVLAALAGAPVRRRPQRASMSMSTGNEMPIGGQQSDITAELRAADELIALVTEEARKC